MIKAQRGEHRKTSQKFRKKEMCHMMDQIPNRLVYEKRHACTAFRSYGSARLAGMDCFSRIQKYLKFGGLL